MWHADQTSSLPESVVPLDSSSSSGLDTTGSSQGALAGTQVLGSVTTAATDSPAQEVTSAVDKPAAGESDDTPVYTLGSDDEDDLTVVSSVDQAKEAQVWDVSACVNERSSPALVTQQINSVLTLRHNS